MTPTFVWLQLSVVGDARTPDLREFGFAGTLGCATGALEAGRYLVFHQF
jgi:hypothetical protein